MAQHTLHSPPPLHSIYNMLDHSVLEGGFPPPSPIWSQCSDEDGYLSPVSKRGSINSSMLDRPLPDTPPVCTVATTTTLPQLATDSVNWSNVECMSSGGYSELDESRLMEINPYPFHIHEMYLHLWG